MARKLKVAAAQLGPIHLADTRERVVARLIALLREAAAGGCRLVVYPELALTTFFPRYWYEDLAEADRFFEREMPGEATRPLFEEAQRLGVGFHLGYAELVEEEGRTRRFNTAILVDPDGEIAGKYRKNPPPGARGPPAEPPLPAPREALLRGGQSGIPGVAGIRRDPGNGDLQRSPLAGDVPGVGAPGRRDGAHRLQHPDVNIYHPEAPHLRTLHNDLSLQSGAYQNGTWVVGVAKGGAEDGHELIAGSIIAAPTGEIVARALTLEDEVVAFDCDLELGAYIKRSVFAFDRHRRPEHYGRIVEQTGVRIEV